MKISEIGLREWVNPSITTEQLSSQLTMAGLEVDNVAPVAGPFNLVVIAKVLETSFHPQANKLTLCQIDFGQATPIQVVCGASNVRPGLIVALARIGATLPGGITIKETRLRGELSQGMLCSVSELGMAEQSEGIMELPTDAPIGTDLREYLMLNDTVLDVDLTPNRADCFSMLGVAREVAVLNRLPLREIPRAEVKPQHEDALEVHLDAPSLCPQYYGRILRGINPEATTPIWLLERLRRAGVRAIHPVVDVTNFVMLELGQPMHAFDLSSIKSAIHVRLSTQAESLTLLDGQNVTLEEKTLIIADEAKPLAIAGVMGGADSAVRTGTTDVFIESAFFSPLAIAGVARRYGLCTESSQRFERGVDPAIQLIALEYATDLMMQIVGGKPGPVTCTQIIDALPPQVTIAFSSKQVERLTGVAISDEEMLTTLRGLGMQVDDHSMPWKVTVPSHRFDLTLDVDLVEEIIRIYGYDKISTAPMTAVVRAGVSNHLEQLNQRVGTILSNYGYHEVISYSFVDPEIQQVLYPDNNAMTLLNPLSSELSQMRVSLWPGLIASLVYNAHRQQSLVKIFESGVIFDNADDTLKEQACIAGLSAGELGGLNWSIPTRSCDFYDLKGEIETLLAQIDVHHVHYVPATHQGLHPGQSAHIVVGDHTIGWIGVLHPRLAEALDLNRDVILFELILNAIPLKARRQYKKISKFPSVRRDLSFLIDEDVNADAIERAVHSAVKQPWLKAFDVFDVYAGESIPAGKKSLAIALTLQDDDRTLVDDEVNRLIDAIVNKLNQDFSITLRD